jgi:hypothetical protein
MSPARAGSWTGSGDAPARPATIARSSLIEVGALPPPTLKTPPRASGRIRAASRFASTTSSTNVKSRACSPSPWITGRVPPRQAPMNRGITDAYSLAGSWPGP